MQRRRVLAALGLAGGAAVAGLAGVTQWRGALGHHWGTFQLSNEPIDEPPRLLAEALERHGVDARRFRPARAGDVWTSA